MKNSLAKIRFLASALACALACALAAGTLCAEETREKKKIAGELQGYFVRVKSGVSGEKEFYYNKDGTLKSSSGGDLLGGDFSLDESLLGEGGLELEFEPAPIPENTGTQSSPAPQKPPAKIPAPARKTTPEAENEEIGTVDEDAILKKFSKEKRDFGINPDNFKKVVNTTVTDRFGDAVSMRDWQGASAYGLRRYSELDQNYEIRAAALGERSVELGLFETRSNFAGEKMFVRTDTGLLEVRLNERFSSVQNMRAAERPIALRETSGFSMQDINRYQFRRNRSNEAGLSVVSPGGNGTVRKETFNKKDAVVGK